MQHATDIARIIAATGMGEGAAINRYLVERRIAEERRSGARRVVSTNWLKEG